MGLVRLARSLVALAGVGVFAAAWRGTRRRIPADEEACFRHINRLPDALHVPVWLVMQAGSLGAVGVAVAAAAAGGRRRLAAGLGASGFSMWLLAKGVKRVAGRGRPEHHLEGVTVRGRRQTGLGFPSGHAAVSMAMATVAAAGRPAWQTAGLGATAAVVGLGRVYVGAHLPLDVVGGAAMGLAAGAVTLLALDDSSRSPAGSATGR